MIEVLKQALDALYPISHNSTDDYRGRADKAISFLLKAIAELESQEPVAWLITDKKINNLQVDSIQRLIDRARHAHMTDIKLRINGQDEWFQADWLKHMVRVTPPQPEQEPVAKYCCHLCFNKSGQFFLDRMILCSECGNKRCPKATSHELHCTNSNEPNQAGSIYTTPPQRSESSGKPSAWVGLTDVEIDYLLGSTAGENEETHISFARAIESKLKELNT